MMENEEHTESGTARKPKKRRWRWLRRFVYGFAFLICVYVAFRIIYPIWIESRLPEEAPRIAFSLDNTVLGRVGIFDASYQKVMTAAGGRLIALRPDAAGEPVTLEAVRKLLDEQKIDGVLLTGGGDMDPNVFEGEPGDVMLVHRARDDFEIALVKAAQERGLPILGVCRGCQVINVALGGTVRNLRKEEDMKGSHLMFRQRHAVDLEPDSVLAESMGVKRLEKVISLHGQVVGELGEGVRVAATGPGEVIEAIEADTAGGRGWIVGVQWHPEMTLDSGLQHKVYQELVSRARQKREQRVLENVE
jgi:putative glutamine amidotransferase